MLLPPDNSTVRKMLKVIAEQVEPRGIKAHHSGPRYKVIMLIVNKKHHLYSLFLQAALIRADAQPEAENSREQQGVALKQ